MDFTNELNTDFQRYVLAFKKLKQENEIYKKKLQTLDKETDRTGKLLQTFNSQDESVSTFNTCLNQFCLALETTKKEITLLEEELRTVEEKYAEVIRETEEDKKTHETSKESIEEVKRLEMEILIQEVEDFKAQFQNSSIGNTTLQLELVSAENEFNRFQKDIQKLEENCNYLAQDQMDLENKITSYKESSSEVMRSFNNFDEVDLKEISRVERQQRLKILDLNKTYQQLQTM